MAHNPGPSVFDQNVSAAIEVARRLRGKSVIEVALAAGIGRASYFNRLAGTSPWKLREAAYVAETLEIPLQVLLDGPDAVLGLLPCTKYQAALVGDFFDRPFGHIPPAFPLNRTLAAA